MREIKVTRNDQRDLILLRNEAAYYMSNNSQPIEFRDSFQLYADKVNTFSIPKLPEPINHHSACENCPYQTICCAFLSRDKEVKLSKSNPLTQILAAIPNYLSENHIDYFIHWTGLLSLEENQSQNGII